MKKVKSILYFIVTFIFLSYPIECKAESFTLTADTIEILSDGADLLSYSGSVAFDFASLYAFSADSNKSWQSVLENYLGKQNIFTINGQQFTARNLTQSEIEDLQDLILYDDDGNIINLTNIYYAENDNGYITEKFYCKNDGSIAYLDSQQNNPALDVQFGGHEMSYLEWQTAFSGLYNDIGDTELNYSLNENIDLSNVNVSCYYIVGTHASNGQYEYNIIYIPNAYNSICTVSNWSTYPAYLYCNPSVYDPVIFASYNHMHNTSYNVRYNGIVYPYMYDYAGFFRPGNFITFSEFLSSSANSRVQYCIDYNGFSYDENIASLYNSNDIVSFKQVDNIGDTLDISKAYPYSVLNDFVSDIDAVAPTPNVNFDKTQPITDINYPLTYEFDLTISDVAIPFPDSMVIDNSPDIEYPLEEEIDVNLISNNIPIISGLQNKFPFSIPWDIYNLVNGLSVARETPSIQHTIEIPIINYDWEIDLDLSMYDDSAELFRSLFLILFIIGLAVFSYQHFFGS